METSLCSSARAKLEMGWEQLLGKRNIQGKADAMVILLHKCASDLHVARSFVHSVSGNSVEAVEGGIWETKM